eukprot:12023098-Prorocentrum_lima.AAC.1
MAAGTTASSARGASCSTRSCWWPWRRPAAAERLSVRARKAVSTCSTWCSPRTHRCTASSRASWRRAWP